MSEPIAPFPIGAEVQTRYDEGVRAWKVVAYKHGQASQTRVMVHVKPVGRRAPWQWLDLAWFYVPYGAADGEMPECGCDECQNPMHLRASVDDDSWDDNTPVPGDDA